jgi:hypothetical protein
MAGGLMQLVAYGAQDVYLTGNPQITFWKVVYRRHTNFAVESIEQVFNGSGDFGKKVVCQIQRNGDLISKMYLRVNLPSLPSGVCWTSKVGHAMIKTVELNIGGTTIDKHYGDWMNVWYELARKFAHDRGYDQMIGNTAELTVPNAGTNVATLYVPLYFFCCRNDGLALPLIATQYHDTRIEVEFQPVAQLLCSTVAATTASPSIGTPQMGTCSLFVDYVYLDSEERKKFAQASHEYLIEQVQFTGAESVTAATPNSKFRLNFNHPCKALYWNVQADKWTVGNKYLAYNPKSWEATKVLATKRALLAFADMSNNGIATAKANILPALASAIAAAKGVYMDVSGYSGATGVATYTGDVEGVTILGSLLPDDLVSTDVETLKGTSTRGGVGDGAAASDVIVRQWDNYGLQLNRSGNPVASVLLQLNGQDRFSKREGAYFNYVQPWQCHSNTPADGVNMYSFALNPEEHQPSGTCNMSRIDNATLNLDFVNVAATTISSTGYVVSASSISTSKCNIYATNYNVLRIMSGMAGLAYSN